MAVNTPHFDFYGLLVLEETRERQEIVPLTECWFDGPPVDHRGTMRKTKDVRIGIRSSPWYGIGRGVLEGSACHSNPGCKSIDEVGYSLRLLQVLLLSLDASP